MSREQEARETTVRYSFEELDNYFGTVKREIQGRGEQIVQEVEEAQSSDIAGKAIASFVNRAHTYDYKFLRECAKDVARGDALYGDKKSKEVVGDLLDKFLPLSFLLECGSLTDEERTKANEESDNSVVPDYGHSRNQVDPLKQWMDSGNQQAKKDLNELSSIIRKRAIEKGVIKEERRVKEVTKREKNNVYGGGYGDGGGLTGGR